MDVSGRVGGKNRRAVDCLGEVIERNRFSIVFCRESYYNENRLHVNTKSRAMIHGRLAGEDVYEDHKDRKQWQNRCLQTGK